MPSSLSESPSETVITTTTATSGSSDKASKSPSAPKNHVGFWEKFAVGSGGLTTFLGNVSVSSTATPFYQMMLGMNPALLGTLLAIPRLWDAITDPIMGRISDKYNSKYGRRRPFIFLGAILMGLSFGAIWMVPQDWSETMMAAWFLVTSLTFYTCFTVFGIPFTSLTFEMTPDYDERTSIMGYTTFWSKVGELAYQWVIPIASLSYFSSKIVGTQVVCWVLAVVGMMLIGILPAIFGKERYYKVNKKETAAHKGAGFWQTVGQALKNKAFTVLLMLTFCQIIAGTLGSSLDYYLLVYYMFDGDIAEGSKWKALLSSGYAVVGFIGIPLILAWSKKQSKSTVLKGIYILTIINSISRWFIYQPGNHYYIFLDPMLGALYWIAIGTVKQSMMADVCDKDELEHGERREGMFSSVFGWITKTAVSLTFFISGLSLVLVGFDSELGGNQSPETFNAMRLTMVLGGVIPSIISLWIMKYYPISRESADETRRQLEQRRGTV